MTPFISVNPMTAVYTVGYSEKTRNARMKGRLNIYPYLE
jgi:hypothetical protein